MNLNNVFKYEIKDITAKYKVEIKNIAKKEWGSNLVVSVGKVYEVDKLKGFVAVKDKKMIGFVVYHIENKECEIIAIYSEIQNKGVGSSLINKIQEFAKMKNCDKIKLITTNDNIRAIKFYQKLGFVITNIYVDSIKKSREIKPQIPLLGGDGIPIRDEIEFQIKI